ncbi:MAG TPA: hypothetical protein VJU81_21785 [Methylomirabilota bacterium]|nr:hypothetical protein [Methylomirabilota bacterium]
MSWRSGGLAVLLLLGAVSPLEAFELYRVNGSGGFVRVDGAGGSCPSAPRPRPVLFVHGHEFSLTGTGGTYQANFTASSGPSFAGALARSENQELGIEAYYIQMLVADRSIFEDALRIGQAIGLIQACHDSTAPAGVRVAVIGYSKGTVSTRVYLRSRQVDLAPDFPGEVALDPPGPNPVTEFVALASPNHGLRAVLGLDLELPVRQLNDGVSRSCLSYNVALATGFMTRLNGTLNNQWSGAHETPGNRAKNAPVADGTLFVSIYATGDRDLVGGDNPDTTDCHTPQRKQAKNLGANAVNIAIDVPGTTGGAVHQNTVKHAEVICRALYTVANHRAPEGPGPVCPTAVDGNPIVPLGTAVTLVLDHSGSMAALACPTCASKQSVLRDAAEMFLSTWLALGGNRDRVGITYFRTGVTQFTAPGGDALVPLLPDVNALVTDLDTNATGSSGLTAMGGGVQTAILGLQGWAGPLQTVGSNRNIVLFTDGMQNVNPAIQTLGPDLRIANQPGGVDAGIPTLLTEPIPTYGVRIHTIGIGPGVMQPSQAILATMAVATGGVSRFDMDAAALQQFFTMTLMDALDASSPQLVAYRRGILAGDETVERFPVTDGVRRVLFSASWPTKNGPLELRVEKDGVDVTRQGRIITGAFYRLFTLDLPAGAVQAAGQWRVRLRGPAGVAYEAAAIVDDHRRSAKARFDRPEYRAGDAIQVALALRDGARPLRGATVTATLRRPVDSVANLLAAGPPRAEPAERFEPQAPLGQRATLALLQDPRAWPRLIPATSPVRLEDDGAGVYRTTLPPATVPGVYTLHWDVAGTGSGGELRRAGAVSTVVRPGPAKVERSAVRVAPLTQSARGRTAELTLSPRDAFDNALGPDLGGALTVRIGEGAEAGPIRDLGNGTYAVTLHLPAGADPTMTVAIGRETLVAGRVSALAPPERGPIAFWVGIALLGGAAVLLLARLTRR